MFPPTLETLHQSYLRVSVGYIPVDLIPSAHGEYFRPENVTGLAQQVAALAASAALTDPASYLTKQAAG
jgi:hypothetical protein